MEEISTAQDSAYKKGGIYMLGTILDIAQLIVSVVLVVLVAKMIKDNKEDKE